LKRSEARSLAALLAISGVEGDRMPRFENGPATLRERVVGCPQRTGQHLGHRDGRDAKAQAPGRMGVEERC
jgi:hypothetical protein